MRKRPLSIIVAIAVAAAAIAAGCGEKSEDVAAEPESFDLALDWFPNPDHAGIFTALERGYFEEAGLAVEARTPSDPSAPIRQVAAGRADLAISYEPEVILARNEGLPVVAVAALAAEPLTSLVSLPGETPIRDPEDLRGKTVATAGIPYQAAYLEAILDAAGLGPDAAERIDVGLNLLPALLGGRADAVLGMFWNIEGVDLEERRRRPIIFPVDELGIPPYDELVLVASTDAIAEDPDPIRLFIAALERGTRDAAADPRAAADAVLAANRDLDPGLTRAQVRATLPALTGHPEGQPYGYMRPGQWEEFAAFLADNQLVERPLAAGDLLTNELLPGEIPE
ncbi:MAG TPA: ABC transporter substrate-binding protein [Solirubrobacterales bacterium]|nr:ABC transporter substrate-binding protein [Solirubrobacterales bacterium]